jgi:pantoate--beta-alanine ligase
MKIARTPAAARLQVRRWRAAGETIGFVPTMGALHIGHRSLLRRARRECDRLVASIFVNPLQFGPKEDFTRYPRPIRADLSILREEGSDLLYRPEAVTLYPSDYETRVSVLHMREPLDGMSRPGHFDGVATVVAKLLMAVEPDRLYLGQKDAQQAVVLKRMCRDLDLGVRIVVCPTVRERDGLACSSRNAYLTREERAWAPALYAVLREAAAGVRSGKLRSARQTEAMMRRRLARGPGRLDYAAAVDAATLARATPGRAWLLAVAYRLGSARLIDNILVPAARRTR